MLEERINYEVITNKLTLAISPPPPAEPEPAPEERTDLRAAVWVVEGTTPPPVQHIPVQQLPAQQVRPTGGVPLRDDEQWGEAMTGELMAVDYLPYDRSTDEADDAEVVETAEAAAAQQPLVAKPRPDSPFVQHLVDEEPPAVDRRVVQPKPAAAKPAAAAPKPAASKPAASSKPKTVRKTVPQSAAPVPVVEEPVVTTEPIKIEEPAVIAREVTARAASSRPAPRPKSPSNGSDGDLEKKRMRARALLSNWPEDRPRTAATLASAIASNETDAARLLAEYDAEHGTGNLTLVANSQS